MSFYQTAIKARVFLAFVLLLSLTSCNYISSFMGGGGDTKQAQAKGNAAAKSTTSKNDPNKNEIAQLKFGASYHIAWMPWFLAQQENSYQNYINKYHINIEFVTDDHAKLMQRFIDKELDAIATTNIDAVVHFVGNNVESDVILVVGRSEGNEALLVHNNDGNFGGKTFAVRQFSAEHYLLDRFLIKNQVIPNQYVKLQNVVSPTDIPKAFADSQVFGVATANPNIPKLVKDQGAQVIFDSREIPDEISYVLVVRRDVLKQHPNFARALLDIWFSVMKRLQGTRRNTTLDALADLFKLPRKEFDNQSATVVLNDTPNKALSALRNVHTIKKTMRHINYFIKRHGLENTTLVSETKSGKKESLYSEWVSYPGRDEKLLHFNAKPLQQFSYTFE
jgi:NitT/TauT family transport system substrate-binding protein